MSQSPNIPQRPGEDPLTPPAGDPTPPREPRPIDDPPEPPEEEPVDLPEGDPGRVREPGREDRPSRDIEREG
jgi:hypothetical protein